MALVIVRLIAIVLVLGSVLVGCGAAEPEGYMGGDENPLAPTVDKTEETEDSTESESPEEANPEESSTPDEE